MMLIRLLKDPLLQFLLLGGIVFGLYTWVRDPQQSFETQRNEEIVVSTGVIERLAKDWERQKDAPPGEEELSKMIEQWVREEVLYREALLLGLNEDDVIIRRRLVQKMAFLFEDLTPLSEPSFSELENYLQQNAEKYKEPPRVSFTHVYFSRDRHEQNTEEHARQVLSELSSQKDPPLRALEKSDPFILQYDFSTRSFSDVERLFGTSFAEAIFSLPLNLWQGPVASSYGLHLVRIHERTEPFVPEVSEIQAKLRRDFATEARNKANEMMYANLRNKYSVILPK